MDETERRENDEAFRHELIGVLNKYSKENTSNTPDSILADYLLDCLRSFDAALERREAWYRAPDGVPTVEI